MKENIPGICEKVIYKRKSYRVTGWYRLAPIPVLDPLDFIGKILFESCQKINGNRMQHCLPEEATHVGIYAVCGGIVPISQVKRTRELCWKIDIAVEETEQALKLGKAHQMVF